MPVLSCVPVKDYSDKMESRDAPVKGEAEEGGGDKGGELKVIKQEMPDRGGSGGKLQILSHLLIESQFY